MVGLKFIAALQAAIFFLFYSQGGALGYCNLSPSGYLIVLAINFKANFKNLLKTSK
jgi:hypothetical protein